MDGVTGRIETDPVRELFYYDKDPTPERFFRGETAVSAEREALTGILNPEIYASSLPKAFHIDPHDRVWPVPVPVLDGIPEQF